MTRHGPVVVIQCGDQHVVDPEAAPSPARRRERAPTDATSPGSTPPPGRPTPATPPETTRVCRHTTRRRKLDSSSPRTPRSRRGRCTNAACSAVGDPDRSYWQPRQPAAARTGSTPGFGHLDTSLPRTVLVGPCKWTWPSRSGAERDAPRPRERTWPCWSAEVSIRDDKGRWAVPPATRSPAAPRPPTPQHPSGPAVAGVGGSTATGPS